MINENNVGLRSTEGNEKAALNNKFATVARDSRVGCRCL